MQKVATNIHIKASLFLMSMLCACAMAQQLPPEGSVAYSWSKTPIGEKQAFLDGYCSGAMGTDTGRMYCGDSGAKLNTKSPPAFCMQTNSTAENSSMKFINSFYKDPNHSDIPIWSAIRYFNDKACKENRVTSQLMPLQEKFRCHRQASSMLAMGASKEAIDAQNAKCATYD